MSASGLGELVKQFRLASLEGHWQDSSNVTMIPKPEIDDQVKDLHQAASVVLSPDRSSLP